MENSEEITPEEEERLRIIREELARLKQEATDLTAKRRVTNNRNRRRSGDMERRIASLLDGVRVPSSGAGAIKGDIIAPSPIGDFIGECKLSQQEDKKGIQHFSLKFKWLAKVREEAREAKPRKRFGVVIFRYHDVRRGDYVAMYLTDLLRLPRTRFEQRPAFTLDVSKASIDFALPALDKALSESYHADMVPSQAICVWADDVYVIMRFDDFRELVYVADDEEETLPPVDIKKV